MMEQIRSNNPPIIIHNINPPILNPKFLPLILFSLLNIYYMPSYIRFLSTKQFSHLLDI